jgi:hypothetical protein
MERYAMNEDRAFAFLVRASSYGNIKLRDAPRSSSTGPTATEAVGRHRIPVQPLPQTIEALRELARQGEVSFGIELYAMARRSAP